MNELSPKIQRFALNVFKGMTGKDAAIEAGYSPKTAESQASRLLRNAKVKAFIQSKLKKVETKAEVTKEYVIRNLKEMTERCMQHQPVMEFDHVEKEMVQKTVLVSDEKLGMKELGVYEFDSTGANKALELLGKSLKMFTDRVEVNVKGSLADRLENAAKRLRAKNVPLKVA